MIYSKATGRKINTHSICICVLQQIQSCTLYVCQIVSLDYTVQCQFYSPPGGCLVKIYHHSLPGSYLPASQPEPHCHCSLSKSRANSCKVQTGDELTHLTNYSSLIPEANATETRSLSLSHFIRDKLDFKGHSVTF